MSKPLGSCLWEFGESVNPPKLNVREVQVVLSSKPKGDPGPLSVSMMFLLAESHPCGINAVLTLLPMVYNSFMCINTTNVATCRDLVTAWTRFPAQFNFGMLIFS